LEYVTVRVCGLTALEYVTVRVCGLTALEYVTVRVCGLTALVSCPTLHFTLEGEDGVCGLRVLTAANS
jgi:hypothetical protein